MQPISPLLLDAATGWAGAPVAQAIIEDRRIRWDTLFDWPAAPDAAPVAQFNNGSLTLRVTGDAAGQVLVARVGDHADPAAWEGWTAIAAGARPACDVAVGWWPPFTWALLYESAAGSQALVRTSTDNGVTWSAPVTLHAAAASPWVALWGRVALVQDTHLHAYRWDGAAWAGPCTLASPLPAPSGGAACWHNAAANRVHALYASGGPLWQATLDLSAATPVWDAPRVVCPGGDGPAATGVAYGQPSLTWVPDLGLVATWLEGYGGAGGWGAPISAVARAPGFDHWGQHCPLAPGTLSAQRWPLAYHALTQTLYCGGRRRLLSAPVYDAGVHTGLCLGPADVLSYRWSPDTSEGAPVTGRLTLELLDPGGAYVLPGESGSPGAAAVRPLAAVRIRRGYQMAGGAETVDTPNGYILAAARSEGTGGGRLWIEAVDAWGLLALWRPPESLLWQDRTVLWLLEEVCARVGLAVTREGTGATGGLDRLLPTFSLHPHHTALSAVQALLRLGQVVARPAAGDSLHVLGLPALGAALALVGAAGEIRDAAYGLGAWEATHVRVSAPAGAGGLGVYGEAEALAGSQAMGMRVSQTVTDNRVSTAEHAAALAAHDLALHAMAARHDRVTVPLRPDLELWDAIEIVAPGAIASGTGARVITGISEEVDVPHGRATSTLTLGAVA